MAGTTIYEFDLLTAQSGGVQADGVHPVPSKVFQWLEEQCLIASTTGEPSCLALSQRNGRRVIRVGSYVGVIRAPGGYQIEVLPKVGKAIGGGASEARDLLIEMLSCLGAFRHIQTDKAKLRAARMPLFEVFIAEFLSAVDAVIKQGIRSDYALRRENRFSMRGRLLWARHLRENLVRADRFFTEHDVFSSDRPENRLIHAALRKVLTATSSPDSQRLARELAFAFAEIPLSIVPGLDVDRVRVDRSMQYYAPALAWARLILENYSPLTGSGAHDALSLLFPMEAVFEAFVAKHLRRQLVPSLLLKVQGRTHHLVRHRGKEWFQMRPDLVIGGPERDLMVLDTKWKLLDGSKADATSKYDLAQQDIYQLQSYGLSYLEGAGDVALVYPRTAAFGAPLPVFEFPKLSGLRLWVLPFCLKNRVLLTPAEPVFGDMFRERVVSWGGLMASA